MVTINLNRMSCDKLDKETVTQIEEQVPVVTDIKKKTLGFRPDTISFAFPPNSTVPVAAVCLQDSTAFLEAVRYALIEALAHIHHYRKKAEPAKETGAAFFGRFYADDAALRLYAASEHLAEAVVAMLEITKEELAPFTNNRQENGGSRQRLVGKFLLETKPDHIISVAVRKLIESKEWLATIKYRNKWVHSKPPIVKGLGIEYERRNRLETIGSTIGISVGGDDVPEYEIDDLVAMVIGATFALVEITSVVSDWYEDHLNKNAKVGI